MTIMELMATLGMDVSGFMSGKDKAKEGLRELKDASKDSGDQIYYTAEQIKATNDMLMTFAGQAASAGAALSAGLTVPIVALASESLTLASAFQQAEIGFTTMMKSAAGAKAFLDELKTFAASTPFEFPELVTAAQRLSAMGFEAKAVIPTLTIIGDTVAMLGTGQAGINRITTAIGQMANSAKVSAQDMNQLVQAGVNAWELLAQKVGVSVSEIREMTKSGLVSGAEGVVAILEGLNQRFAGSMDAQSRTIAGQWSNIKDQITFILADIGKALMPFAQSVIDVAKPVLEFIKGLVEGFNSLPGPIQTGIVAFAALAAAVGPALLAFAGFTAAVASVGSLLGVAGLGAILSTIAPWVIGITAAVVAASAAFDAWHIGPVQEAIGSLGNSLQSFWNETLKPVVETVAAAGVAFATFASDLIGSGLHAAWEGLVTIGASLWEGIKSIAEALEPLWQAFLNVLDALSPLLEPLEALLQGLGKVAAVLLAGGLIVAFEAWKAALGFVAEVVGFLAKIIADNLMVQLHAMVTVVSTASNLWASVFKPAVEFAINAVKEFLGVLAGLPGVKQAVEALGGSFESLKAGVTGAMASARESIKGMGSDTTSSMKAAKEALDEAKTKAGEVATRYREGKASVDELKTANDNLVRAQKTFNSEMDIAKPKIESVMRAVKDAGKEYDSAEKNVKAVEAAQRAGNATAQDVVNAHVRMKTAADNLKDAQSQMKKITDETGISMNEYGGGVDRVKTSLLNKVTAVDGAESATKRLKKAVDEAKESYRLTYEQYTKGLATEEQVAESQTKLQKAFDALHPEKVAERQAKGHDEMMKRYEEEVKWFETNVPKIEALNSQWEQSIVKLAITFGVSHDKMAEQAKKQIAIDIKIPDRFSDEINDAIAQGKRLAAAYKDLGSESTASLEEHARRAKEVYDEIANDADSSAHDRMLAEKKWLDATIKVDEAAGREISDAARRKQKELEDILETSHNKQKGLWDKFVDSVNDGIKNIGRGIGSSIFDAIFGGNDNARLDQEMADLQKSLADKTKEWEDYQRDVAEQIEAIHKNHADKLAQQVAELQGKLADKRDEWERYQSDVVAKLEEFKAKQDAQLQEELAQLADNLAERAAAWEQYKEKAESGLADFTAKQDAELVRQLSGLQTNLDERRSEWEKYQQSAIAGLAKFIAEQDSKLAEQKAKFLDDLNDRAQEEAKYRSQAIAKLSEFTQEQDARLAKEQESLANALSSEREEYFSYVEDVNAKLATLEESSDEKLAEDLERLQESFADKTKAYEEYVADVNQKLARIGEDLEEQIDDERRATDRKVEDKRTAFAREERDIEEKIRRELDKGAKANQEQIRDWRKSLADKREDLDKYLSRAEEDLNEFVDDHKRSVERQTSDLQEELQKRSDAQQQAEDDYHAGVQRTTDAAKEQLEKQRGDLLTSLSDRTKDWNDYQIEIARKQSTAQADHDAAIEKEKQKVSTSLADRLADWEKYQKDVAEKIANAQKGHDDAITAQRTKVQESLNDRKDDWEKYQQDIAGKITEAQRKHDEAIAGEQKKVADSLAARLAEWEKYQADIATKITNAQKKHDDAIENEEKKVAKSLEDRKTEWDKYQKDIEAKIQAITKSEADEEDKQIAALKSSMEKKRGEYNTYVSDTKLKLQELADAHKTIFDRIGDGILDTLKSVGQSITETLFESLTEKLFNKIKQTAVWGQISDFMVGIFSKIGKSIIDIFGGIGDSIGKALGLGESAASGAVNTGSGAATGAAGNAGSSAGSAGSAAASGVTGIVGAIGSVASAVSGIIGNFQMAKQETTLNAIEESTRYTKIATVGPDGILPTLRDFLPGIKDLVSFMNTVMQPALADIASEITDKGSGTWRAVIDVKNEIISVKDGPLHDIVFSTAGTASAIEEMKQSLVDILGELQDGAQKFANAIEPKLAEVVSSVEGIDTEISNAFTPTSNAITSGMSNLLGAFNNLNIGSQLSTGLTGMQSAITSAIYSIDPKSTLTTSFINLQGSISSLGSSIGFALTNRSPIQNTSTSNTQIININGVSTSQQLASALRTYGVALA